ncbi:MAG: hypothetical protein LOX97_11095 [Sphingomonas sp.]|nr:hypothetical protein [Sphingomonas sp.]
MIAGKSRVAFLGLVALLGAPTPARAELIVSDLVVELGADLQPRRDVEVWNNSNERSYVEIAPVEVLDAGRPGERRVREPNPEKLGLLVSPNRMILEPHQRKLVRIASIADRLDRERVYRITIKPVVGEVSGDHSGLKVLVGYDVLALLRPASPEPRISGTRDGRKLVVRNDGNASAELMNGRQCDSAGKCVDLPGKRLYAGASWTLELPGDGPAEYVMKGSGEPGPVRF